MHEAARCTGGFFMDHRKALKGHGFFSRLSVCGGFALLAATSGCLSAGGDDKPIYASDSTFTRPWATCLATNTDGMDDGVADPWMVAQSVAEECSPDLLSAFRRETTETDKRKAYALTAEKAEALVRSNRRDRANGLVNRQPDETGPAEPLGPGVYGMGMKL